MGSTWRGLRAFMAWVPGRQVMSLGAGSWQSGGHPRATGGNPSQQAGAPPWAGS